MNIYAPYLLSLQRRLPHILLLSLLAAAVTYAVVNRMGAAYKVHLSLLVSLAQRETADEYTFDGLYALQSTELFTATLAEWTATPAVIVDAYREAGLPVPTEDARQLSRRISAKKTAPQLVEISVAGSSRTNTEHLARGLVVVTQKNVEMYQREGVPTLQFRVVASKPWTSVVYPATSVIVGGVFFVTFLLLVNGVLVWKSLGDASSS